MVLELQAEFRAHARASRKSFQSVEARLKSNDRRFASIDERFASIDKRFDSIDKRFDSIDKRFEAMEARMEAIRAELLAEIHSVKLLVEEQNAQNKLVMDAVQDKQLQWERAFGVKGGI